VEGVRRCLQVLPGINPGCDLILAEVLIDGACGLPSLCNCPDHQRLAAPDVTSGEHPRDGGHIISLGGNIAARIQCNPQFLDHSVRSRAGESQCKQDKINLELEIRSRNRFKFWRWTYANGVEGRHISPFVSCKANGCGAPLAYASFLMRGFRSQHERPHGPGRLGGAIPGRLR
jgi:hypothetical protein